MKTWLQVSTYNKGLASMSNQQTGNNPVIQIHRQMENVTSSIWIVVYHKMWIMMREVKHQIKCIVAMFSYLRRWLYKNHDMRNNQTNSICGGVAPNQFYGAEISRHYMQNLNNQEISHHICQWKIMYIKWQNK